MEKRKLEKLGVETSLLGFGCMRFPMTEEGKIDEPEAERMLDRAISAGVNYIDTAYPYHGGESEPFVGRALKKYDRDSFYLATKLPCWKVGQGGCGKNLSGAVGAAADGLHRFLSDACPGQEELSKNGGNGLCGSVGSIEGQGRNSLSGVLFS